MGTVFTITVPASAPTAAITETFEWFERVEATFSTFVATSEISRIGREELDPDEATVEVRHVLARCEELESATEGRFVIRTGDPTRPPLDPAGFVKGWSVDEAALVLRGWDIDDFSIYAGGDVLCAGKPPSGDRWRVGIRHPARPDGTNAAVLEVPGGAVATSAAYYRGDHIRVSPGGEVASVTVAGPSLGVADALATAIFADQARSLDWLGRFPEYGVLLLDARGKKRWTSVLEGMLVR